MGEPAEALPFEWTPQLAEVYSYLHKLLDDTLLDQFRVDITDATLIALTEGDTRGLNETVEAWYRMLLFKRACVDEHVHLPADSSAGPMTAKEVRAYLGV